MAGRFFAALLAALFIGMAIGTFIGADITVCP